MSLTVLSFSFPPKVCLQNPTCPQNPNSKSSPTKMSRGLDMSLDDIIKNSKHSRGRGRGLPGSGPARRYPDRQSFRSAPYPTQQNFMQPMPMQVPGPILQQQMIGNGGPNSESGTKLYVSNLDYGVSNEDVKVLFSEVGELKRYSVHYDRSGRSKGTAEVVFLRQADALAAMKRYNNVQLDGKPMQIELVGVNLFTPAPMPIADGILGKPRVPPRAAFRSEQGRVGFRGRGRGRGHDRGHGQSEKKVSAQDLDADLDKYHLQAVQIN